MIVRVDNKTSRALSQTKEVKQCCLVFFQQSLKFIFSAVYIVG